MNYMATNKQVLFSYGMATRKGCTGAQLALAWVHQEGSDVVPILNNFNQNTGAMAESSNVSSPIVQEGVNGHVSQLPNGHVSQLSNGDVSQLPNGHVSQLSNMHVSQLPNGHTAHLPNEHVSQSPRERLVAMLYREVSADMRKVDQYHRMSRDHWRSVRRLGVSIAELRDLDDWDDGDVTLGLLERLRLENVEKAVRLRLMMKETEVKIAEKNISIRRLRRNGAV
ncbi:hypothetical protein Tco_0451020 [Tanacetum coccineum]